MHHSRDIAFALQAFAVRNGDRDSRQKHKQLGRVTETEVAHGDVTEQAAGDVIPEDVTSSTFIQSIDCIIVVVLSIIPTVLVLRRKPDDY